MRSACRKRAKTDVRQDFVKCSERSREWELEIRMLSASPVGQ
jgi:hypothetical protein